MARRAWTTFHLHLVAAVLTATSVPAHAAAPELPVVGGVEKVTVGNPPIEFEAKIDTGADISSIDATGIAPGGRGRGRWIEFVIARADGTRIRMRAPLVRHANIKRSGMPRSRRPVVLLEICLGPHSREVEVSLTDRKGLDYDVLIGKNVLSGRFVVNPALSHALPPNCTQPDKQ